MPKWDEDFSIVLLRLGIASLDATSVAGLGNEVSWIALTDHAESVARERRVHYGEAEMNRSGISSITHTTEYQGGRRTRKEGFANEIRRVKVGSSSHGDPIIDPTWFIEFKRFGYAIARCGLGLGRMAGRLLRGHPFSLDHMQPLMCRHMIPTPSHQASLIARPSLPFLTNEIYMSVSSPARCSATTKTMSFPLQVTQLFNTTMTTTNVQRLTHQARRLTPWCCSATFLRPLHPQTAPVLLAHMTDTSSSP